MIRLFPGAALALLLAGLAACATPAPRYPVRAEPAAPPVAAVPVRAAPAPDADPASRAVPSGVVTTGALPPVQGAAPPPPAPAPEPAPVAPSAAEARLERHVVRAGDTLYAVARRFSVGPRALAEYNGLPPDVRVRVGQTLRIPGGTPVVAASPAPTPPAVRSSVPPPSTRPPVAVAAFQPRPAPPAVVTPPPPASVAAATRPAPPLLPTPTLGALTDAQIAGLGQGRFLWPVRGEVLSGFGPKGVNQRNDGINIAAGEGTPVKASAGGEVVYAGDQVPGFGNLVLVKHPDGFVTAYGHLARTLVKNREQISQGHVVGEAGASGGVPRSQLHFEVRYAPSPRDKARPVNPQLVLPR